jgi:catechol 2,3-dioxygenase-like lactoylglutathione lyase family enzyme
VLGPLSGGESLRVGVADFDPTAVARRLKDLGGAEVALEKTIVAFRDPDGIKVQIGG